jgi:hypothetical protein
VVEGLEVATRKESEGTRPEEKGYVARLWRSHFWLFRPQLRNRFGDGEIVGAPLLDQTTTVWGIIDQTHRSMDKMGRTKSQE